MNVNLVDCIDSIGPKIAKNGVEGAFIPEESIVGRRPRGDFHAMYCVVLPVALPLIMSVYLGVAESAARKARASCAPSA
jgi:hypothetical protein